MSRILIQNLSTAQLSALPRTTRWRAEKRGWIAPRYHEAWTNRTAKPSPDFDVAQAYSEARIVVASMSRQGYPFPCYLGREDLIQEAVSEVWRISAKPDYLNKQWRMKAMRLRLLQISKAVRGDRDKFNRGLIK